MSVAAPSLDRVRVEVAKVRVRSLVRVLSGSDAEKFDEPEERVRSGVKALSVGEPRSPLDEPVRSGENDESVGDAPSMAAEEIINALAWLEDISVGEGPLLERVRERVAEVEVDVDSLSVVLLVRVKRSSDEVLWRSSEE